MYAWITTTEPDRLRRSEEIKVFKIGWYFPQILQKTQRKCLGFPADFADLADLALEGFGISRRSRRSLRRSGWGFPQIPQISQILQWKWLGFPVDPADLADLAEEVFGISRRSRRSRRGIGFPQKQWKQRSALISVISGRNN